MKKPKQQPPGQPLTLRAPQDGERSRAVLMKDFAALGWITQENPARVEFMGYPFLSAAELRWIADRLDEYAGQAESE